MLSKTRTRTREIVAVPALFAALIVTSGFLLEPSWPVLLEAAVLSVFIALVIVDDRLALLGLIVVRPLLDVFSDTSLISIGRLDLNVAAVLGLGVILWGAWVLAINRVRVWHTPLIVPFSLFIGALLLTLPGSLAPLESVTELIRMVSFGVLLAVAYFLLRDPADQRRAVIAFAASFTVPCLIALWQFVTKTGLTFGESVNRVSGTFGHPNVFAFALVLGIAILLPFAREARGQRRTALLVALCIGVLLLLLTGSRGAWLGLAIVAVTYGFLRERRMLITVLAIITVLVALFPVANNISRSVFDVDLRRAPVLERFFTISGDDSSITFRFELWHDMSQRALERPILGFGLGTFPILREQQVLGFFQGTEAHNDYLRLTVETGFIGLVSYLVVLAAMLRQLWRLAQRYRSGVIGRLTSTLLGFGIALVVMSFFDNLLQATPVMWEWWLALATLAAFSASQAKKIEPVARPRRI